MAATRSQHKSKSLILQSLKKAYPELVFKAGDVFMWSARENTVYFPARSTKPTFPFSLLHETGHALLGHKEFSSDLGLLKMERDAWDKACEIAHEFDVEVPADFVEECMDTYRDWLYARSLCPHCHQCGIQTEKTTYSCVFCRHHWTVSESRLCRVTRRDVRIK